MVRKKADDMNFNKKGIVMLEIVVSTFIIGIAAVVSATMIISALQGNRLNKNKLIAMNLAKEGVEAVKNIIDGNQLRYKANRNECWNFWENPDASPPVTTCDFTNPNRIDERYYKVNIGRYDLGPSFTPPTPPYTYKWYLSDDGGEKSIDDPDVNTPDSLSDLRLELWTLDSQNQSYNLYVANTHPEASNVATNFYRQIYIEYVDTDSNGTLDPATDTAFHITSIVVWFEKSQKKKVKLTGDLSNFTE